MGNNKDCPCCNCTPPIRHLGCHGECEQYKAWLVKHNEIREKEREEDPYFANVLRSRDKRLHIESRKAK